MLQIIVQRKIDMAASKTLPVDILSHMVLARDKSGKFMEELGIVEYIIYVYNKKIIHFQIPRKRLYPTCIDINNNIIVSTTPPPPPDKKISPKPTDQKIIV